MLHARPDVWPCISFWLWKGYITVAPYTLANIMYCMQKIWTKTHPYCRTALIQYVHTYSTSGFICRCGVRDRNFTHESRGAKMVIIFSRWKFPTTLLLINPHAETSWRSHRYLRPRRLLSILPPKITDAWIVTESQPTHSSLDAATRHTVNHALGWRHTVSHTMAL